MSDMTELLVTNAAQSDLCCPLDVFDVYQIRDDFPILQKRMRGKQLVYLDNAATTQKPRQVIEAMQVYYERQNANIHRGVHYLSELATKGYEDARQTIVQFINAKSRKEVIFTRGTTESINLVATSYGFSNIGKNDEILISAMEHHSNIVPWQLLCERSGATLKVAPIDDDGDIIIDQFNALLSERTKMVAIVHVSNSLGTINPIKRMIDRAHDFDIPVLVDGAQAVSHLQVDVQALGCDFYAFSGHKLFGPTGIGVLYGKESLLNKMPPYQGGGDMIKRVTFDKTTYNDLPAKFEAGTPNIAGAIGFAQGIQYFLTMGYEKLSQHEDAILKYAQEALATIPDVRIIGTAKHKASVVSFVIKDIHPHDIGTILDQNGIAVRTGHHCTQPVMDRYQIPATTRASFALYNTVEEVNALVEGLHGVLNIFK